MRELSELIAFVILYTGDHPVIYTYPLPL